MDRLTGYNGPRVLRLWPSAQPEPDASAATALLLEADTNGVFRCPDGSWSLDPVAYLQVRRCGGRLLPAHA